MIMKIYDGVGGRRKDFDSTPKRMREEDIENAKAFDIPLPKGRKIREFSVLWWIILLGCVSGSTILVMYLISWFMR